jgi:hypothetical protein
MYIGPVFCSSRCGQAQLKGISATMSEVPTRDHQLHRFFKGNPKIVLGSESSSRKGLAQAILILLQATKEFKALNFVAFWIFSRSKN